MLPTPDSSSAPTPKGSSGGRSRSGGGSPSVGVPKYVAAPAPAPVPTSRYTAPSTTTTTLQPYTAPSAPAGPSPAELARRADQQFLGLNLMSRNRETLEKNDGPSTWQGRAAEANASRGKDSGPKQVDSLKDTMGKTYKPKKTFQMTWDDYNRLGAKEKAAVDFNTQLVGAREKDLAAKVDPTPQQEATFEKAVTNMFGKDGGTDTYAPQTLAVLRQIEFDPGKRDVDFDDFLGLKAAIKVRDLKNFRLPTPAPAAADPVMGALEVAPQVNREALTTALATGTKTLEQKLTETGQMLRGFQGSAKMARNEDLAFLGGQQFELNPMPGFGDGTTEKDKLFQTAFDLLALKSNDPNVGDIWATVEQQLSPYPGEMDQFKRYIDARTASEAMYALDPKAGYRSPEEFRQMLNLGGETPARGERAERKGRRAADS